ncbi:MAG: TonB-dependent receptor [Bacteroidaceae bacterium]|nr:TonB-dependent receptor [Bacteroidaceae bacterium]
MMKKLLLSLLTLVAPLVVWAQTITVNGTVTENVFNEPVMGATVVETGTSNGVATDLDGRFTLTVPKGKTITISFVGYKTQVLQPQATMNVVLEENTELLDEMVVVGYQTVRKADLTGAVGVMDMKKPQSEGSPNMLNSLQGRISGVNVVTDPAPGGGSSSIQIRGMSNFNGNNSPLYIIDGVATTENLNSINPADIESLQILKDASSASIYGSRAANGVVIITTKKGKGDKLSVNVGYTASAQVVAKKHDMLSANEWGTAYYRAMTNSGQAAYNPYFTYDTHGNAYLNPSVNGYRLADTDWQDEVYRTAWTHNVNASVSNASDKGTMLFSGNYIKQDGVMERSTYDRYTVRLNSTYKISKYIEVGENLMLAKWNNNIGATGGDAGIPFNAMRQFPGLPVRQPDGSFSSPLQALSSDITNPVHELYNSRDNTNESWRIFGNAYLQLNPIEGLALKSSFGIDHIQFDNTGYGRPLEASGTASVSRTYGKGDTWTWTNTANYNHKWGEHTLTALLGTEAIGYHYDGFSAYRDQYAFLDKNYMTLGAGEGVQTNDGGKTSWGLFSLFGKADYNYADRYLASFTLRRDQSSRLGKHDNSGVFPAVSAAWRISSEPFFHANDVIDDIKLRLAWGQNGNSEIGNYATYSMYAYNKGNAAYDLNGTGTSTVAGVVLASSGNTNIKWETTTQTNIGLDMRFLGGSLGFSGDFYIKKTRDMLTQPPVLSVAGENAIQWQNTGDMRNVGIEATIDYRSPSYGDFSWEGSLNMAHYKNKVLKLNDQQKSIGGDIRLMEGQPMGVYYGYVVDGLFQNQTEVYNHATQQGAAPGRLKYRDLNGDGIINESDRCIIGDPSADFSMGLNLDLHWKQWTLSMFFTGEFGFDIYNMTKKQLHFFGYGNATSNRGSETLNAWTPTNTGASVPAIAFTDDNNEMRMSTYYIEDGSYFKMKYIKLSYSLPEKIRKKFFASNLNVFGQVENLFTITGYDGLDPEIAIGAYGSRTDNGPYPRSRTFTLGFNVTF